MSTCGWSASEVLFTQLRVSLLTFPGLPLYDESDQESSEVAEEQDPILKRSVTLKFPTFPPGTSRNEKVSKLEDHIVQTAAMRCELAELRLNANTELKLAQDKQDAMQASASGKTSLTEAKRRANPALARTINDAKWLVQRCSEEMERMDADYTSASRAYTMITGS